MRKGLGFHARHSPGLREFSPSSLFTGGVQGAWFDPSDSTTLFSDRAGTTPCAAPGAGALVPVGAMLDERAPGYSVFFDGTGDYLTLTGTAIGSGNFTVEGWVYPTAAGSQVYFDCRNADVDANGFAFYRAGTSFSIFTNGAATSGGTISNNVWTHLAFVRSSGTITAYINGVQAFTLATSANFSRTAQVVGATWDFAAPVTGYMSNLRVVVGTAVYTGNFTPPTAPLAPITGTSLLTCGTSWSGNPAITKNGDARVDGLNPFQASPVGNHAIAANDTTARPELSARVNLLNATATLATQSVTTVATNYTMYFTGAGSIALSGTASGTYNAGTHTITCTAGTLTLTITGTVTTADLRPANIGVNLPVYQAVVSTYSYDTVGFPRFLRAEGASRGMYTPSTINLGGNKVTAFAGVRKQSDAALGVIMESSATIASNNGAFLLSAPNSAAANYNFSSKGTTQVDNTVTTFTAPLSSVLSGQGDIGAPSNVIRVNGVATTVTSTQGTGNYATYSLNLFGRNSQSGTPTAGTILNGDLYSVILVAGSTGQVAATEQWIAGKMSITI